MRARVDLQPSRQFGHGHAVFGNINHDIDDLARRNNQVKSIFIEKSNHRQKCGALVGIVEDMPLGYCNSVQRRNVEDTGHTALECMVLNSIEGRLQGLIRRHAGQSTGFRENFIMDLHDGFSGKRNDIV